MGKCKLIWEDFFNCKIVVVCESEDEVKDFFKKMEKWHEKFAKDELVFHSENCTGIMGMGFRYNFWLQKKGTEFNIKNRKFAY